MSSSSSISESKVKRYFGTLGIFVFFGFLALILFQFAGSESVEDRAARGDFDEATIQARWDNLKATREAQVVDDKKLAAAMAAVAKSAPKPAKTAVVVPGSPTFLKQMEAASAPAPAPEAKPAPEKPAAEVKPVTPQPKVEAKPAPVKPATEVKPAAPKPKAEATKPVPAKPADEAKPEAKK